jgi:uncharacterized protein involved in exopolysaccharide biosynthesis
MQDEIDLRVVFRNIWARKIFLFVSVAVFYGLSYVYLYYKKPLYAASSKFAVKVSEDKAAGQLRNLAALAGINVGGGGSSVSPDVLFTELLGDDDFLEPLIRRKWLVKGDSITLDALWKMAPDTTRPNWEYRYMKQRISRLRAGKTIKLDKNKTTGIITLSTLFPSPELAYQVNAYLLKLFDDFMIDNQITQAGEKKKFINARIEEVEKDLYRSEKALVDFQMQNKNVTIPTVMMDQIRLKRNMEVNQELYLQLKKQLEFTKIEEKNDQPVIQLISRPALPISFSKPNHRLVHAGFLFLGTVFGFGLIIAHYAYTVFFRKPRATENQPRVTANLAS